MNKKPDDCGWTTCIDCDGPAWFKNYDKYVRCVPCENKRIVGDMSVVGLVGMTDEVNEESQGRLF